MKLELFYDIVSPYSYLAFTALERYRAKWSMELVLRPALLGGVMKAVGNVPPASLPARAPYLLRDMARLSKYFRVPMTMPDPFPGQTLPAMRFLTAVDRERKDKLADVSRALWVRHWGQGLLVDSADALLDAATDAGIEASEAKALVERIADPAVKDALRATTDEVVARGAFGFPAMFATDAEDPALYFGSDRLELLAFDLGLPWEGPCPS